MKCYRSKIHIDNIERFGIVYDNEMFMECIRTNIKSKDRKNFKPIQKNFQDLFLSRNTYKKYVSAYKSKGLQYDLTCLKNSCSRGDFHDVRDMLQEGIVPDLECIYNWVRAFSSNELRKMFIKEYENLRDVKKLYLIIEELIKKDYLVGEMYKLIKK